MEFQYIAEETESSLMANMLASTVVSEFWLISLAARLLGPKGFRERNMMRHPLLIGIGSVIIIITMKDGLQTPPT